MLNLSNKDFKAVTIKMLQQAITNPLRNIRKSQQLEKYTKEPIWNYWTKKYSNQNKNSLDGLSREWKKYRRKNWWTWRQTNSTVLEKIYECIYDLGLAKISYKEHRSY